MTAPDQPGAPHTPAQTQAEFDDQLHQSVRNWRIAAGFVGLVAVIAIVGYFADEIELASLLDLLVTGFGLVGIGHTVHAHGIRQEKAHHLRWWREQQDREQAAAASASQTEVQG